MKNDVSQVRRRGSYGTGFRCIGRWFLGFWAAWVVVSEVAVGAFGIVRVEREEDPVGWHISWTSTAGELYRLEATDDLGAASWSSVALIEAASDLTMAFDSTVLAEGTRRFWRVVRWSADGGLFVSPVAAYADLSRPLPETVFSVRVWSDVGVEEVRFFSGEQLRGVAMRVGNPLWELREVFDPDYPQSVTLRAEARDALDRTGVTGEARFLLADPERFVPLDGSGRPMAGHFLRLRSDGSLEPFEFRPDGRAAAERQSGLALRFPAGARVIFSEGAFRIETDRGLTVRRGWFDRAPVVVGAGVMQRIPTDSLRPADLAPVLGLDPVEPITLWSLGDVPTEWSGGALGMGGVQGLQMAPAWNEVLGASPLPGPPERVELMADPATGEVYYQVTFHGTYLLPGGLEFRIPRQAPWVFRIYHDRRIELSGETEIRLPNGGRLAGSVGWRNGAVTFSLAAHNLALQTLGSLLELLPPDPAALVPGNAEDSAMNLAAVAFEAYRQAYRNFAAGAVRIDEVDRERDLVPLLDPVETATASLGAWSWRLLAMMAEGSGSLGGAATEVLARLTANASESGQAAYDLPEVLAWKRELARLHGVLGSSGLGGDAAALRAEVETASTRLTDALRDRLRTTDREEMVGLLAETARAWLDLLAAAEESGSDLPASTGQVLGVWLREIGGLYFARLGVEVGEFDPVFNDTVLGLDRFTCAAALTAVLDLYALAQGLGWDAVVEGWPVYEALHQLVTRMADVHEADLRDALERNSFELAMIVARQRLELMAGMQLLGLDQEFPDFFVDPVLSSRWDEIADDWLNDPSRPNRRDSLLGALRYLAKILAYVPHKAGQYSESVQADLVGLLEEFLATGRFNDALGPSDWLEWLEGGLLADRLGRLYFTHTLTNLGVDAENRSALQILVDGLIEASGGNAGAVSDPQFAFLDQAASRLLAEIQLLRIETEDPGLDAATRGLRRGIRLSHLEALGRVLAAYQRVATRLYSEAAATPGTLAYAADLLLPGAIQIHDLAGSARFRPASGFLAGRFSGSLALPKFDARLTVANASFDTRGNFQLAAYGQAGFPGGAQAGHGRVVLRVPARRPLELRLSDTGSFGLSGGAELELPGGHQVSGYLSIDDPEYLFELAYGGSLRFDLFKEVVLFRPVLDPEALPDLETLAAAGRLFGSLGTGFEAFLGGLDEGGFPSAADLDPGAAPEFSNPVTTLSVDAWDAWLTAFANENLIPQLNGPVEASLGLLSGLLGSAREEFEAARGELAPDLNRLRLLRERLELLAETRETLDRMADSAWLGLDDDIDQRRAEVRDAVARSMEYSKAYLASLPADASLPHRLAAIEMELASTGEGQAVGVDDAFVDKGLLAAGLRAGALQLLQEAGLAADGTVVDAAALERLSFRRLMVLGNVFLEFAVYEQSGDLDDAALPDPVIYQARSTQFYRLARDRMEAQRIAAQAAHDLEDLAVATLWLLDFNVMASVGFNLPPTDIADADDAFAEMLAAIRSGRGSLNDQASSERFAWEFVEVAQGYVDVETRVIRRETEEQLGQTEDTRVDLAGYQASKQESRSLLEKLALHWGVLADNGLLDPTRLGETQFSLRGWFGAAVSALNESAFRADGSGVDPAVVEETFNTLFETLLVAADVLAFIEEYLPGEAALLSEWKATWEALHLEWVGVAQARQAWWYLGAYAQELAAAAGRYGDGVGNATATAFRAAAGQAVVSLQAITSDFAGLFNSLDVESFKLSLPGDLLVERLFGRLEFNRHTTAWQVRFGGALRFPEANLSFVVERANLASDGNVSLALRTSGPAPFGLDDTLRLDVANAFSLSGNLLEGTLSSASAAGTLTRELAGGGVETYGVQLGYVYTPLPPPLQDRGEHRFDFSVGLGGELEVFTPDLVIFRGGLGFSLVVGANGVPQQGALSASAVVGILAKDGTGGGQVTPDDFLLRLDGQAALAVSSAETTITLSGVLRLPEGFQAAVCGTSGVPDPAAGRPVVSVPAGQPLVFTYRSPDHPNAAVRDTVAFSGGLALAGLRFSLPDLDLVWVDVCSLELAFGFDAATGRPRVVMQELEATINLPLPGGKEVRTGVKTANWSIHRLPEEGVIFLQNDLTLFQAGGFKLELLGIPDADLLGLPRTFIALDGGDPPGTLPSFIIHGSLRSSAGGWFTDESGDAVVLTGMAENVSLTVRLPPDELPSIEAGHFVFDVGAVEFGCESSVPGQPCKLYFTDGIAVVDPRLRFTNPLRALRPTRAEPFEVEMDLAFEFVTEGPTLTIAGEKLALVFDGSPEAPLVKMGAAGGCIDFSDSPGGLKMTSNFPLYVKKFCVALKNLTGDEGVPLFTEDPTKRPAFSADNLEFTVSAGVDFGDGSVNSIIYGEVDDVVVGFVDNQPTFSIDGIGIGVDFTSFFEEFPFKGKVYLSGFQSEDEFFLSGMLGANIKGNLIEAVAALNQTGPIGLCVGLAGAEVNIPIYAGFVLTGAKGGIIRGTGFQDPCAFITRYQINPQTGRTTAPPQPPSGGGGGDGGPSSDCEGYLATYDQLQAWRDQGEREQIVLSAAQMEVVRRLVGQAGLDQEQAEELVHGADFGVVDDLNGVVDAIVEENGIQRIDLADLCAFDCPPASLGAMAQMHPEAFIEGSPYQGRAIWKFTSVDETTLNFFGINLDRVDGFVPQAFTWNPSTFIPEFAGSFAEEIRLTVERLVPRPPIDFSPLPTPDWALEFENILTEIMNEFELGLYNTINCGLRSIVADDLTRDDLVDLIWGHLREAAYAGIPYEDVTIRLQGSFSYAGVASFASVTGGILYTPGSSTMGVMGSINVFGIPFGYLQGFISSYDAYGNPQLIPALCGEVVAAIGPLEFGRGSFLWDCPDCFGRIVDAFDGLGNALTAPYVYARMLEVAPDKAFPDATVPQHLLQLSTGEEKIAFITAVLNRPPTLNTGQVTAAFRGWFIDLANSIAQRMVQCGATQPKLFGFPLSGDNVYQSYASYFGPKDLANYDQDPSLLFANRAAFSPFQMAAQPLVMAAGGGSLGAVASMFIPAIDQAVLFSVFEIPNLGTLVDEFLSLPLNEFVDHQFRRLIATSSNTFEYQLSPLGLELSRAGGRLLFPSFDYHPARQDGAVKPSLESRDLPSRRALLLAALRGEHEEEDPDDGGGPLPPNQLADPNWRGTPDEIAALFAGTSYESVFSALPAGDWPHLVDDYFPHGGMIGAAEFRIPRLLSQGLPPSYFTVINPGSVDIPEWLQAVADFLAYLGATDPGGQLGFYLPAPNPPSFLAGQFPASAGDLLESLRAFDPLGELGTLYPLERAFFQGEWDVPLLGLPLVDGLIDLDPAVPIFRFEARVPEGSWLDQFVGANSRVTAEMRLGEDSDLPIAMLATEMQEALTSLGNNPTPAQVNQLLNQIVQALSRRLPRAALSYSEQLQVPAWLADFVRLPEGDGSSSAYELFAFTPQFEPDFSPGDTRPYALARRQGGVGFRGDFYLGYSPLNLELRVQDASFLVLAGDNPLEPRLVANLEELSGSLPFAGLNFDILGLSFDTQPGFNGTLAGFSGRSMPPDLGPLVQFAAPGQSIAGRIQVRAPGEGQPPIPTAAVFFDAAELTLPVLGGALASIYGAAPGEPWGFSNVPGEPWNATIEIHGGRLSMRDPLAVLAGNPSPDIVLEIDSSGASFFAQVGDADGSGVVALRVSLTGGGVVRVFPGRAHEAIFTTPDTATCLIIESTGRAYFDSGTRELDLAFGLAQVTGRIEFGVEPPMPLPVLAHSTPTPMSVTPGTTTTRTVSVSNTATGSEVMVVDALLADAADFDVIPTRHMIPAGESRQFLVRFTPQVVADRSTELRLRSNATVPEVSIPLVGTVNTAPRFQATTSAVDFGLTPLGIVKGAGVVVVNTGSAVLTVSGITTSGPGFSIGTSTVLVPAGQSRSLMVEFLPQVAGVASGHLTFSTNDPDYSSVEIPLSGHGENRFWVRQRRGTGLETFAAIAMGADGRAAIGGGRGARMRGSEYGRLWQDAAAFDTRGIGTLIARTTAAQTTEMHLAGEEGWVMFSANGGQSWQSVSSGLVSNPDYQWYGSALRWDSGDVVLVGEVRGQGLVGVMEGITVVGVQSLTGVAPLRDVAFGTARMGIAVGDNRTILRLATNDEGRTWMPEALTVPDSVRAQTRFRGIAVRPSGGGATYVVVGDNGTILRTTDSGHTWSLMRSGTLADLHDVSFAAPDRFIAVGDGGVILAGSRGGSVWNREFADTTGDFRSGAVIDEGLESVGTEVWAVTADGDVWHRKSQAVSGPVAVVTTDTLSHPEAGIGEPVIREIRIGNAGVTSMTAQVETSDPAFVVLPEGETTVGPGEERVVTVGFGGTAGVNLAGAQITVTTSDPSLAELGLTMLVEPRRDGTAEYERLGYLAVPARIDLGTVAVGAWAGARISVDNIGMAALTLEAVEVRHNHAELVADNDPPFTVLAPGQTGVVEMRAAASAAGRYSGTIEFASDAANGVAQTEWTVTVVDVPEIVIIGTNRQLPFYVDNDGDGIFTAFSGSGGPRAFTVVDRPVAAGAMEIRRGTTIRARCDGSIQIRGAQWVFQGWSPGTAGDLEFVAGASANQFTALFQLGPVEQGGPGRIDPVDPVDCEARNPGGVTAGPWLRISQAKLSLPWLADPESTEFAVEGSLLLSWERAYGSLSSGAVQLKLPHHATYGPMAGTELLRITPAGWAFDLDAVERKFVLRAGSPGLQVFGRSLQPPSEIGLQVDLGTVDARAMALEFSTADELPLIPGLLALKPGVVRLESSLAPGSLDMAFSVNGGLLALAHPTHPGQWVIDRPYTFEARPNLPLPGVNFGSDVLLANLGAVQIRANSMTTLGLDRVDGGFQMSLTGLLLEFLGGSDHLVAGGTFDTAGAFTLEALLPIDGLATGPVRLRPHGSSLAARRISVNGSALAGQLEVDFPRIYVNSAGNLWSNNTVGTSDRFIFDSANLTLRLPLAISSMSGFAINAKPQVDADNYFEFRRRPNTGSSLRIRAKREYVLGDLKMKLDVSEAEGLSGAVSGRLGAEGPPPLHQVDRKVSLSYKIQSGVPVFSQNRHFLGIEFALGVTQSDQGAPDGVACIVATGVCFP